MASFFKLFCKVVAVKLVELVVAKKHVRARLNGKIVCRFFDYFSIIFQLILKTKMALTA